MSDAGSFRCRPTLAIEEEALDAFRQYVEEDASEERGGFFSYERTEEGLYLEEFDPVPNVAPGEVREAEYVMPEEAERYMFEEHIGERFVSAHSHPSGTPYHTDGDAEGVLNPARLAFEPDDDVERTVGPSVDIVAAFREEGTYLVAEMLTYDADGEAEWRNLPIEVVDDGETVTEQHPLIERFDAGTEEALDTGPDEDYAGTEYGGREQTWHEYL